MEQKKGGPTIFEQLRESGLSEQSAHRLLQDARNAGVEVFIPRGYENRKRWGPYFRRQISKARKNQRRT